MNKALTMLMTVVALAALGAVEADNNGGREGAKQEKPKQFFKVFPVGTVQKEAGKARTTTAVEWTKFRGDLENTGYSPGRVAGEGSVLRS